MPTFKDTKGREWDLAVTFGVARRISDFIGVSVLKTNENRDSEWVGVMFDPENFIASLWVMIRAEAERRSVTRDDFEDAFGAETYQAAMAAWWDAFANFTQRSSELVNGAEMVRRLHSMPKSGDGESPAESVSTPPT